MYIKNKSNYVFYGLAIAVPGFINFLAIPVFKRLLGAAAYGEFNLYFTSLLVLNMVLTGWISQSMVRLSSSYNYSVEFTNSALFIGLLSSILGSFFVLSYLTFFHGFDFFYIFFVILLVLSGIQLVLNGAVQASLKGNIVMFSEVTRVGVGFFLGVIFISYYGVEMGKEFIFISFIVSNFLAIFILLMGLKISIFKIHFIKKHVVYEHFKEISRYGFFLMLWFFGSYVLMYNDRYLIFNKLSDETAGHYTSLFDLISRSITMTAAPFLLTTFPLLASSYDSNDVQQVRRIIKKLYFIQLIFLPLALICYSLFGYSILEKILKLPVDGKYFWPGFFILLGSIVWQISVIAHKELELLKKTRLMFFIICFVVLVSFFSNLVVIHKYSFLGTSIMYCLACALYFIIVQIIKRVFSTSASISSKNVSDNYSSSS